MLDDRNGIFWDRERIEKDPLIGSASYGMAYGNWDGPFNDLRLCVGYC